MGGVLLGFLAIAAWVLSTAAGRNGGLGITTPSAKIVTFLTTGDVTLVDWSVMLVLGILVGSFIAAKLTGEFRWRVPDAGTILRSAGGGVAMGVGALAGSSPSATPWWRPACSALQLVCLGRDHVGTWVRPRIPGAPTEEPPPRTPAPSPPPLTPPDPHRPRRPAPRRTPSACLRLGRRTAPCAPSPLIDAKNAMQQLNSGDDLIIGFDCTPGHRLPAPVGRGGRPRGGRL